MTGGRRIRTSDVREDGTGLVVKRIEALTPKGTLRLVSAHPDYPPYECPACDVHIVGKVRWKVRAARSNA